MPLFDPATTDFLKLVLAGAAILASVLIGQYIYRMLTHISELVEPITEQVHERKRPPLMHVILHMFWAPFLLAGALFLVRAMLNMIPVSRVTVAAAPVMDAALLGALLWSALRVFRTIIAMERDH